jgi:HPr kinase/phosphorylase
VGEGHTFKEVIEQLRLRAEVELLNEHDGAQSLVTHSDVHRPGMALMGYQEGFQRERIQICGATELGYLRTLSEAERRRSLERIFALDIPGIFVAEGQDVDETFQALALQHQVPVARVALPTDELIEGVRELLGALLAPRITRHATLVDIYGVGVLVTGRSGIGKSETALDLVERGHRLVADDLVVITRQSRDVLVGAGRENAEHLMEIRGLGIIDIFPLFGVRAIRMQKRVEVELRLEDWDDAKNYDRHGLDREATEILGVAIPKVTVPIFPGKNNTVIAEVVALDFMLKTYGIDSAQDFNRRLVETMSAHGKTKQYLTRDRE